MTKRHVPLAKPAFDQRETDAVHRVLESGWVIQGKEVQAFEKEIARIHQMEHCIAVTSGTSALHVAFLSMDLQPGEAVFVPSFAWPSAANMALMMGARPVYVDVLPNSYNMDANDLRKRIDECIEKGWGKPRLVVVVHEFGLAADLEPLLAVVEEYKLDILEDAACALGATYKGKPVGHFSPMSILSFHPRKSITTGEGGAILTNDAELDRRCRMWRNQGQEIIDGKKDFETAGPNYRMTEFQAAIGSVQLDKFPDLLAHRRKVVQYYYEFLAGCEQLELPENNPEHTWQTFMVVLKTDKDRADVIRFLGEHGFGAGLGSMTGHCMNVYREKFGYQPEDFPNSLRFFEKGLALPLHHLVQKEDIQECCRLLREFLS